MAKQGKRIEDMTTDEVMEKLFPKKVIQEAEQVAGKPKEKSRSESHPPNTKKG
jgi:hypothetical protein